MDDSSKFY